MITVDVTYSEKDYLRAVKFLSRRHSIVINLFIAFGVMVVGIMIYRANYNEMGWWVKPFFGGWLIFFTILFRMVQLRNLGKVRKSTPAAQGEQVWTLTDESIRIIGPLSTSEIKWEAIVKARETRRAFFFYLSGSFALFLPKRVFANERQMIDLRHLVGEKLGNKAVLMGLIKQ